MRLIKFIILSSLALLCAGLGTMLVINNPANVSLNLLLVVLPDLNVIFLLMLFLLLGALLGYSYASVRSWFKSN